MDQVKRLVVRNDAKSTRLNRTNEHLLMGHFTIPHLEDLVWMDL